MVSIKKASDFDYVSCNACKNKKNRIGPTWEIEFSKDPNSLHVHCSTITLCNYCLCELGVEIDEAIVD